MNIADKVYNSFFNPIYNTFTTAQAAARYNVDPTTIRRAVKSLRLEGHAIYRNVKTFNGRKINVYRLGTPSKAYTKALKRGNKTAMLKALNGTN